VAMGATRGSREEGGSFDRWRERAEGEAHRGGGNGGSVATVPMHERRKGRPFIADVRAGTSLRG
jgi:hypothetical protein